jgi:hypothetical protein
LEGDKRPLVKPRVEGDKRPFVKPRVEGDKRRLVNSASSARETHASGISGAPKPALAPFYGERDGVRGIMPLCS